MANPRIALVQLRISDEEAPQDRLERVIGVIEGLAGQVDLVVLPELWLTGAFATKAALAAAEPLEGPTFSAMSQAARRAGLHVLAGSLSEADGDKPYNTAVVYDPQGQHCAVYRKIHLFGFDGGEADSFAAGAMPQVWESPWGSFGLATCYDLRFPELFRVLVDQGAEGFLVPTGWPAKRIQRWDVLAQARAIENQAWFVGVNAVGSHAGFAMGGHSVVVDPRGESAYLGSGEDEDVAVVTVDMAAARQWREDFPSLRDRRL